MNVESLKSELQQVLDSDVLLRKEFNELKRSLSDYRNQLIMRDEDCKRLQVTIDVLNTKLVVMERDNTNYKGELSAFKELRGSIKEQLEAKQVEIDARLAEIQDLKNDLNTLAADYEQKIEALRQEAGAELERVQQAYSQELSELKVNSQYKEGGIRDEYENRLSELSIALADQEQRLRLNHEEALLQATKALTTEIEQLKSGYETRLETLQAGNEEERTALLLVHSSTISSMQEEFDQKTESMRAGHAAELAQFTTEAGLQREHLHSNFSSQAEALKLEFNEREGELAAGYDALKASYEAVIQQKNLNYVSQISTLSEKYESRLSNALIHSNVQNSKLSQELSLLQQENERCQEKIQSLVVHMDGQHSEIEHLSLQLDTLQTQLSNEAEKFSALSGEYASFKQSSLLSANDQVNELNGRIDGLNEELANMGNLLEATTNQLGDTEGLLETANGELTLKGQELEALKADVEGSLLKQIEAKEVAYQKLLVENESLIDEINQSQNRIEAFEAELELVRTELVEVNALNSRKAEDLKEILSDKNFELTNLEANNAALSQEALQMKLEIGRLEERLENSASHADEAVSQLQHSVDTLSQDKTALLSEINSLQGVIANLSQHVEEANGKLDTYESEMARLKHNGGQDQDDFIDRLFKQIDVLNDQRLGLLDEKEQMAAQLLKMNELVGMLSQEVDSERIDVTGLNNHRKNVILAKNLGEGVDNTHLKEQINDLVREIDKCIALLSA